MAKNKQNKLPRWIIIPLVVIAAFGFYVLSKDNSLPTQQNSADYVIYQDATYGFAIEYPKAWEIRKNTQVFENGDAIAFRLSGPTQKENTELDDGAQIAISKPFSISKDLSTWVREYYDRYSEFSKNTLGGRTYQQVYSCGHSCMTYYYTIQNDKVFGIATFAQGASKTEYESAISLILETLQFGNTANGTITKEGAIVKVKAIPEVADYIIRVPQAKVEVSGEENDSYLIQVFEVVNGHSATFNWYKVDKTTGEVKREF